MNKNIDRYWHEESTLVFKSKDEKVVIGRYDGTELIDMDDETVTLADEWKFKLDPSMIEEESSEEFNESNSNDVKDEEGKVEEVENTGEKEEELEGKVEDVENTEEKEGKVENTEELEEKVEDVENTEEKEGKVENTEEKVEDAEEKFNFLVDNVLKMYKDIINSYNNLEKDNGVLKQYILNLEEELTDVNQKYKKLNNKLDFLKQNL